MGHVPEAVGWRHRGAEGALALRSRSGAARRGLRGAEEGMIGAGASRLAAHRAGLGLAWLGGAPRSAISVHSKVVRDGFLDLQMMKVSGGRGEPRATGRVRECVSPSLASAAAQ